MFGYVFWDWQLDEDAVDSRIVVESCDALEKLSFRDVFR